jgi:hypothetical protein
MHALIPYFPSIVTMLVLDDRGLFSGRDRILIFATVSRLTLGPTQSPFQWVPGAHPGGKAAGCEADHLHLVPKLRMHGVSDTFNLPYVFAT